MGLNQFKRIKYRSYFSLIPQHLFRHIAKEGYNFRNLNIDLDVNIISLRLINSS